MIHSAKPTVSPVANIVFCLFCLLDFKKWGRTDGRTYERTTCAKTMIPTGCDCGPAEWINYIQMPNGILCYELVSESSMPRKKLTWNYLSIWAWHSHGIVLISQHFMGDITPIIGSRSVNTARTYVRCKQNFYFGYHYFLRSKNDF